jgi:hypothetical protein
MSSKLKPSLQHFINRHNVLSLYRKALRIASQTRSGETHKLELFREIRTQFETHRNLKNTHDISHLLSDARLRLRELRELVDMTL